MPKSIDCFCNFSFIYYFSMAEKFKKKTLSSIQKLTELVYKNL